MARKDIHLTVAERLRVIHQPDKSVHVLRRQFNHERAARGAKPVTMSAISRFRGFLVHAGMKP